MKPAHLPVENASAPIRLESLTWAAAGLILLAGAAVYANSLYGPFIFDDFDQIVNNPRIHHLWPLSGPMAETTRPVGLLTFALNVAVGGMESFGYHLTNVIIHLVAGLVLFDLVRLTLARNRLGRFGPGESLGLAFAVALLWTVHPLQTAAVTYIVQRLESLMGLFYLLTLYGFARAQGAARPGVWYAVSIVACGLGMATKEVMVTAPLAVLWYDWAFVAGSWKDLGRRWKYYALLAATWLVLAGLVVVRFNNYLVGGKLIHVPGLTPASYLANQALILLHYLRLSVWPAGLCLDYDWTPAPYAAPPLVLAYLAIAVLLCLVIWAAIVRPAWGFVGGWFFLILSVTSSVVPIADLAFEHRMYLPLAPVLILGVVGGYLVVRTALRRLAGGAGPDPVLAWVAAALVLALVAAAFAAATVRRNRTYQDSVAIWEDTVLKAPGNARAYNNLGTSYLGLNKLNEAYQACKTARDLKPNYPLPHNNLGIVLCRLGRAEEGVEECRTAIRLAPGYAEAHNNLGAALRQQGKFADAVASFKRALEIKPDYTEALVNLGNTLCQQKRPAEAVAYFEKVLVKDPRNWNLRCNYGNALREQGKVDDAIACFREILIAVPDEPRTLTNLAMALSEKGKKAEAMNCYQRALAVSPNNVDALVNAANMLARAGNFSEATAYYRKALDADANSAEAHGNFAVCLLQQGKTRKALEHGRKALDAQPDNSLVQNLVAWTLATSPEASLRDGSKAVELAERAVKLSNGQEPQVLDTLAAAYAEAGRYRMAADTARQALEFATKQGDKALADAVAQRLKLYSAEKPYREAPLPPPAAKPGKPAK